MKHGDADAAEVSTLLSPCGGSMCQGTANNCCNPPVPIIVCCCRRLQLFIAARIGREGTWNYGATPPTAGEAQADASRAARIVTRFAKDVDVEGSRSA